MDSGRRDELEQRRKRHQYSASQAVAAEDLVARGLPVGPDDGLAEEASCAALDALAGQQRFHLVWHRVWGVRLRGEMVATVQRIAERIGDDRVTLIWRSTAPAAFAVSARDALNALASQLGPESSDADSTVVLVSGDGQSGLVLEYSHMANADEYELRTWGRFNVVLDA